MSAYVTHGVFPNFSWMKFKADTGGEWRGPQAGQGCVRSGMDKGEQLAEEVLSGL